MTDEQREQLAELILCALKKQRIAAIAGRNYQLPIAEMAEAHADASAAQEEVWRFLYRLPVHDPVAYVPLVGLPMRADAEGSSQRREPGASQDR